MNTTSAFLTFVIKEGFKEKKENTSYDWSYTHPSHGIINCRNGYIYINNYSTSMRKYVSEKYGKIANIENSIRAEYYREYLSNQKYYHDFKNLIRFSHRASGTDYVGMSEKIGINTLANIFKSFIADNT